MPSYSSRLSQRGTPTKQLNDNPMTGENMSNPSDIDTCYRAAASMTAAEEAEGDGGIISSRAGSEPNSVSANSSTSTSTSTSSLPTTVSDDKQESSSSDDEIKVSSSQTYSTTTTAAASTSTCAGSAMQMSTPLHPVAEFLFQLTKMLTDANSDYIEWRNGSIFVHDPPVSSFSRV
jgi:hypothetical protein